MFQQSCQTRAVRSAEAEVQAVFTATSSTQTEQNDHMTEQLCQSREEPEPPGLLDFLRRVEDMVVRELAKNARSHAFDGFQANWEDHNLKVRRSST